uniref:Uncharacterized protein n=1 Tax=Mesocestoides corti TaxID=53468 RepID=A0A5K3G7D6_MESCO
MCLRLHELENRERLWQTCPISRIWIPTSPLKYFNKLTPSPLSNRLITFVG